MAIYEELVQIVGEENVKREEPLSEHTTFRIGGPARFFAAASGMKELERILACVRKRNERYFLIGNGSNLLVPDTGFDGVVISTHKKEEKNSQNPVLGLQEYREVSKKEMVEILETMEAEIPEAFLKTWEESGKRWIMAGSGIMLSSLANGIAKRGLAGFEFAAGIPGTLGGAVAMNAGAYGGEIADVILGALVLTGQGEKIFLEKSGLGLGYRSSRVQKENMVVLSALFGFEEGKPEEIRKKITELNEKRREKQPLNFGSAGSTFKRPEGYFAGKLIEDAGLKGYRVGDVMVSEKHAGFVVNAGNGTYEQAMAVIRHVQEKVQEKFGVSLETEVKILG